jgi:superfamily I DNA/RNA helicase
MKSLGVSCEIKYDQPDNTNGNFPNSIDTLDMSTFNPKIMTYHSAKGLQFENVFIPWVSESDKKSFLSTHRTALYVAMTRTYRNLFIMHTGSFLPHPLAFIPKEMYLTTMTDNVEDM